MRSAEIVSVLVLVALSGGCECGSPAPPTAPSAAGSTSPPSTATTPAPGTAEPAPAAEPARPTAVPAATDAPRRRALLAEGRRLERSGDHAGAIARYREALAIAPGDASVLGELGWALFHAGELEEAWRQTELALGRSTDPRQQGALLYNLGRIAEARGATDDALALYQRSIAARPNDTVAARIVALGGAVPGAGELPLAELTRALVVAPPARPSLEAVCDAIAPGWRDAAGEGDEPDEEDDGDELGEVTECTPELDRAVTSADGILEAGVVEVRAHEPDSASEDHSFRLVARTAAGWIVVTELASASDGTQSLNYGEAHYELELRDVIPGGGVELVARAQEESSWAEWCFGGNESRTRMLVCGARDDRVVCWLDATTHLASSSGDWTHGYGWAGDMDEDEIGDTCASEEPGEETRVERTVAVAIDPAGLVTFSATSDAGPLALPAPLRRPIELTRLPCLEPHADPAFGCAQ